MDLQVEEEEEGGRQTATTAQTRAGARTSGTNGENHAMIPYVPLVGRGEPLSRFEQMVLGQLDTMANDQRDLYEFSVGRFQHLDNQIEVVQDQLAKMAYGCDTYNHIHHVICHS